MTIHPRPDGMLNVTPEEVQDALNASSDTLLVRSDGTLTPAGTAYVSELRSAPPLSALAILTILNRHDRGRTCQCGFDYFYEREHRAHVADVLAEAIAQAAA